MKKDRPSATACLIAGSLYRSRHDSRLASLVSPTALAWVPHVLEAYGRPASWFKRWIDRPFLHRISCSIENILLPGIVLHYMARKHFIEDALKQGLNEGIEQVVIIGSGFDTLAMRLHAHFPDVEFIEIDHPATQRVKKSALERMRLALKPNLSFFPMDLTGGLPDLSPKKTFFIIEGVLMYLPEQKVRELLAHLAAQASVESQIVFTVMNPLENGRISFKSPSQWVDVWMRWRREPFSWGISPSDMAKFLSPLNWNLKEYVAADQLRERYLTPINLSKESLAEGEYIVLGHVKLRVSEERH